MMHGSMSAPTKAVLGVNGRSLQTIGGWDAIGVTERLEVPSWLAA